MTTAKHPHNSNKGKRFKPNYLTQAEAQAIFDACPDNAVGIRNRALLVLLYYSGLRPGEALSLETGSIDLDEREIRVLDTKSGDAQQRAYLSPADDDLRRWIKKREELGVRPGAIFCRVRRPAGAPLVGRQIRQLTENLAEDAGVHKRVNPHIFRHSFAMYLYREGFDVVRISKLLGHKDPSHTMTYLNHLTNGEAIRALHNYDRSSLGAKKAPPLSEPEDWFDYDEQW